jgi:hypothetical protein
MGLLMRIFVDGVSHGKFNSLEKPTKLSTSSMLLIETVPKLVRFIDPNLSTFNTIPEKYKYDDFKVISLLKIALITEIPLS